MYELGHDPMGFLAVEVPENPAYPKPEATRLAAKYALTIAAGGLAIVASAKAVQLISQKYER